MNLLLLHIENRSEQAIIIEPIGRFLLILKVLQLN